MFSKFFMIKAVIFDLDQVLIKSIKPIFAFYKVIFKKFGLKFPKGKKRRLLYTLTGEGNYKVFFSKINEKEYKSFIRSLDFNEYIKPIEISKNAIELLKYLKKKYKIALVTNRGNSTYLVLDKFKIKKYFDVVLTGKDIKKPKPNPYPINLVAKKLKLGKTEILYVGDDIVDIGAGKRANVNVVLYKNKFKGADYYINDLKKIKKIIGDINV